MTSVQVTEKHVTIKSQEVEARVYRRIALPVSLRQARRAGLVHYNAERRPVWPNDGSCIQLRPERPNHVWSYDFVQGRSHGGRPYRILDKFTREALMICVARKLNSTDVLDALIRHVAEAGILEVIPLARVLRAATHLLSSRHGPCRVCAASTPGCYAGQIRC